MSGVIDVKLAENDSDLRIEFAPGFRDELSVDFVQEDNDGLPVQFSDIGKDGKNGVSPIIQNGTWWTWSDTDGAFADTGVAASGGGDKGDPGATFTPFVDAEGNLSWTNDGGLSNPATVNIKGDKGDKGDPGQGGAPGQAGYTPRRGTDYWTDADKAEIVSDVLAALPDGDGVSY